MTPRIVPAILALVLLASLAPTAMADHVYSHRYLVYGRAVDASGLPYANARIEVELVRFDANLGYCPQDPPPTQTLSSGRFIVTTDAYGDFYACNHIDGPVASSAEVVVKVGNVTKRVAADPDHRESFITFQVSSPGTSPAADWNTTYVVRGLAWQKVIGKATLERISVNGNTIGNVPVTVTLSAGGETFTQNVTTSREYGWFIALFSNVGVPLAGGNVTVSIQGNTVTVPTDPVYRFSQALVDYPAKLAGYLKWSGIVGAVIVLLIVVLGGGTWAWSRMSEARALDRARQTSTRKRSKK